MPPFDMPFMPFSSEQADFASLVASLGVADFVPDTEGVLAARVDSWALGVSWVLVEVGSAVALGVATPGADDVGRAAVVADDARVIADADALGAADATTDVVVMAVLVTAVLAAGEEQADRGSAKQANMAALRRAVMQGDVS